MEGFSTDSNRRQSAQFLNIAEIALPTRGAFVSNQVVTADEGDLTGAVAAADRL
jgi:hypothetical protein